MKILFAIPFSFSILFASQEMDLYQNSLMNREFNKEADLQEFFQTIPVTPPIADSVSFLPAPHLKPAYKSPALTVGLSSLFPGLGHVYLEDYRTASGFVSSVGAGVAMSYLSGARPEFVQMTGSVLLTSYMYGIYAAYRDVRQYNGGPYSYKMPTDSLVDLTFASFKPSILKKPEVWGGVLGALTLAVATTYFAHIDDDEAHIKPAASSEGISLYPPTAFAVGIREEAFFRGYLQSHLSEMFNPITGIILSSLMFGAAHISNAAYMSSKDRRSYYTYSIPFITVFGAYFGWLTHKNRSLQESVAVHGWYDFTLFALHAVSRQTASTGRPGFAISLPF